MTPHLPLVFLAAMKVIAAYLLAVLGGKNHPSADDLKDILGSGHFLFLYVSLEDLISIAYIVIHGLVDCLYQYYIT